MRKHLRWLVPLVCIPVGYFAFGTPLVHIANSPDFKTHLGLEITYLVLALLTLAVPVAGAVLAVRGGRKTWKEWRHANGHFSAKERVARDRTESLQRATSDGWQTARTTRQQLIAGQTPAPVTVWELVPRQGETMYFDLRADYSRYYGTDVSYTQTQSLFVGRPAFVMTGLALTSLSNSSRRNAAEAQARAQWREHQSVRLVVTSHRLACLVSGQWLSFDYSQMSAVFPEAEHWALICEFTGQAGPLLLSGPWCPLVGVLTIWLTHGAAAVAAHPSLAILDGTSAVTELRKA